MTLSSYHIKLKTPINLTGRSKVEYGVLCYTCNLNATTGNILKTRIGFKEELKFLSNIGNNELSDYCLK